MRRLFPILISLAVLLCACTVQKRAPESEAPANAGTEAQQMAVQAAAKAVVTRLDGGRYADAWSKASPILSAKVTQDAFARYMGAIRTPLGTAGKRRIKGFGFPTEVDGAPPGQYGVIALETDFANAADVEEKLVFELNSGEWRLVGYWLSKKFTLGAGT